MPLKAVKLLLACLLCIGVITIIVLVVKRVAHH
jgi:Flp pilus assembly protein protease CpaA